jgi:hypothetical protein
MADYRSKHDRATSARSSDQKPGKLGKLVAAGKFGKIN